MKHLLAFAVGSLLRRGSKNLFIFTIFCLLVSLLASTFMLSHALKSELFATLQALPQITVQRIVAGRQSTLETERAEKIAQIPGVARAIPRVWGFYHFPPAGVNFSVVGIESFTPQYTAELEKIADLYTEQLIGGDTMVVGEGVEKILKRHFFDGYLIFVRPDGELKRVAIAGRFKGSTALVGNDIILMESDLAREIFGMPPSLATDIVVEVPNSEEVATVARKIADLYPDSRIVTRDDLEASYRNLFNYEGGIFLALFLVATFTLFIILYDKASGLSSEEKREIGILKALGWRIGDILRVKLYEALILSMGAYLLAITLAIGYVFGLQAPVLKSLFTGYSVLKPPLDLPFVLDGSTLALIFFATVPVYIAATLIPSWRAATLEADEVIR
ncbi:ABC transporter permease [Hydrogenimonas sp.]